MKRKLLSFFTLSIALFLGLSFFSPKQEVISQEQPSYLWQVRSVDTMKTSRDKARVRLHDLKFDAEIEKELLAVKNLGANYVAIDTPYDEEFLPYLTRWVQLARKMGLRVWFRGNWSNWEGWFDYPKDLTPEGHQTKTAEFIETHPDLFEDGDIFDPCPECENAGFWKQPDDNAKYNEFLRNQRIVLRNSFSKINKKVYTNVFSIIGGRAKEVLDKKTLDALDNLVTIDHYSKNPSSMTEYIDYFSRNFQTKVLIGEFGAPIPDINGSMDENQQALFIGEILRELYKNKSDVFGINYNVLTLGTTKLLNDDGTERQAVEVIKNYFIPGAVKGTVTNTLGDKLGNIPVKTGNGLNSTITGRQGHYKMSIPVSTVDIVIGGNKYKTTVQNMVITRGGEIMQNAVLEPEKIGFIYRVRLVIQNLKKQFFGTTN
ncbi:MAG: hypothetical protein KKD05_10730 [Candidatus Omnitrophica bacterium]|nr:hypothetical protein [Candidatus Omnitrophota bacterium]